MAQIFKAPQMVQPSLRGAQIANAPTRDMAAWQKAENVSKSLDLINNIAQKGIQVHSEQVRAKNINDAKAATNQIPSYIDNYVRSKVGNKFKDLSNDEINSYTTEALSKFNEEKGINESTYAKEASEISNDLLLRVQSKAYKMRDDELDLHVKNTISERTYQQASNAAGGHLSAMDLFETIKNDHKIDKEAVGPLTETQIAAGKLANPDDAKAAQLNGLIKFAASSGSPEVVDMLKSSEAREYFGNAKEYSALVDMAEKKSLSVVTARKGKNFDDIKQQGYGILNSNGFTDKKQVDSFIKEALSDSKGTRYAPNESDIYKLKQTLYKGAKENSDVSAYQAALQKGDYTWIKTSGLKEKEQEAIISKAASLEIGVSDFSPASVSEMLNDSDKRAALSTYLRSGQPIPEQLKVWVNETPVGGWQGIQKKFIDFQELSVISEGRINDIANKQATTEMLFVGKLIDNQSLTDAEKTESFTAFKNDIRKNVDSYGNYYSPAAREFLDDKDVQKDIAKFSKDAPWTTDDNLDSAYIARQVKGNIGLLIAAGYSPNEAFDRAKDMFDSSHVKFELPNGEEGILTPALLSEMPKQKGTPVAPEKLLEKFVYDMKVVRDIKKSAFFSNNFIGESLFKSKISYRPTPDHEKTKEYHVLYDGKPIADSRFTPKEFSNRIAILEKNERTKIEQEYRKKK